MKVIAFLMTFLVCPLSIISQEQNDAITAYNEKFEIGKIQYKIDFSTLNPHELQQEEKSLTKNDERIQKFEDSIKQKYPEDIKNWYYNMKLLTNFV